MKINGQVDKKYWIGVVKWIIREREEEIALWGVKVDQYKKDMMWKNYYKKIFLKFCTCSRDIFFLMIGENLDMTYLRDL